MLLQQIATAARHARNMHPQVLRTCIFTSTHGLRRFASSSGGYQCADCGQTYVKWQGQCTSCSVWGMIGPAKPASALYQQANAANIFGKAVQKHKHQLNSHQHVAWSNDDRNSDALNMVQRMNEVEVDTFTERIALPERELNWVFGGGLVAGSLTLVAGNPGVGKSTLALQIANMLAADVNPSQPPRQVLYVSGEESAMQVKMRAGRLGSVSDGLFVASQTNIDAILRMMHGANRDYRYKQELQRPSFDAVVVDSIQTIYAEEIPSAAGTVNQVKECTLRLLRLAKQHNVPVILIGHVTKSGDIAGPKVLEHIVDTVVQLEGDPQSARRFLRCQKNRFGNTSEVGVFNMTDTGLQPLVNPLLAFVSSINTPHASHDDGNEYEDANKEDVATLDGASITIAMEGSRPIPLEIQALANKSHFNVDARGGASFSRVRGVGVSFDKLQLLFAVMEKRAKVSFHNQSIFVNIAEGYTIQEPAADLALAVALASSVLNRPVLKRSIFLGEIALSGHLRPVKMLELRLSAAQKIGVEICVIPKVHCQETKKALSNKFADHLTIIEASTVLEALKIALQVEPDVTDVDASEFESDA